MEEEKEERKRILFLNAEVKKAYFKIIQALKLSGTFVLKHFLCMPLGVEF
jgi:hypothetical protein